MFAEWFRTFILPLPPAIDDRAVCIDKDQYFTDSGCRDCPGVGGRVVAFVSLVVALLLIPITLHGLHEQRGSRCERFAFLRQLVHRAKEFSHSVGLIAKLKLMLTFCQVIANLGSTYSIMLPDSW